MSILIILSINYMYSSKYPFEAVLQFSRIHSKGSRCTPGVCGLRVCSLDIAFAFASVRSRSPATVGGRCRRVVPVVSSAKGSLLEVCCVATFRVACVALPDIQTCFSMCQKSFSCGRCNTFAPFSKDEYYSFHGMHRTLDMLIFILCQKGSTLEDSCCVLFANRIVRAASSGDTKFRGLQASNETSIWRYSNSSR